MYKYANPYYRTDKKFELISDFQPRGDQAQAVASLAKGLDDGLKYQTLLGITGSGKTYTMAKLIERMQRPSLIIAHNKTLAAQLCSEFKEFFPNNAVEYFISYYDYYQPEAYIPGTDTYIEKDSAINDEIERLRYSATSSLLQRRDVIVVASVSCIYGIGSPENYANMRLDLRVGDFISREKLIENLVNLQYQRNEFELRRSCFRSKGDIVDVFPVNSNNIYIRLAFFDDELESICEIDKLSNKILNKRTYICIHPASHYAASEESISRAMAEIKLELNERIRELRSKDKLVEAYRLEQRTRYDLQMMKETGFTKGIENYSRFLDGRKAGEPPSTLLDFFPEDYLLFIDESHVTIPQIGAMYAGDFSRKKSLVDYGFRLPSAFDNRPLNFKEFEAKMGQTLMISATPSYYEREHQQAVVQQIIRPTGLLDPKITIVETKIQIEDLQYRLKKVIERKERALILTLSKKMAEDFTQFLQKASFKVKYLHSDIPSSQRLQIIKELREGKFDILVGINLLREGIDLPEVSMIAIMEADKEGFLRSETSLIQMIGRAARNVNGEVILYADKITNAMYNAVSKNNERRKIQEEYNKKHQIVPKTVYKKIRNDLSTKLLTFEEKTKELINENKIVENDELFRIYTAEEIRSLSLKDYNKEIQKLKKYMMKSARDLNFEQAMYVRDCIADYEVYRQETDKSKK